MVNILFVYPRKMATTELLYEVFVSEEAVKRGINAQFVTADKIDNTLFGWSDVMVFVRNHDLLAQWILCKAKEKGIFCIQFFDDDIMNLSPSQVNKVQYLSWRKKAVKRGFEKTDLILSFNEMLAKKYAALIPSGRNVTMDTVVDTSALIEPEERSKYYGDKVKLVYAAGAGHEEMFDKYVRPIIPELIRRFGNRISLTFFAVKPDFSEFKDELEIDYVPGMPLKQYRERIRSEHFDLGLSPLESNDFSQYKHFNKFMEYTIAGITGVYSNILPYTLIVKDRVNGFLADNTYEGWLDTLCAAIEDTKTRQDCYANAYELVTGRMTPGKIIDSLSKQIPELTDQIKKEKGGLGLIKIRYFLFRALECVYLVFEYIKGTGIKGTVAKIKDYRNEKQRLSAEKHGE